jgi:hypothetical protein
MDSLDETWTTLSSSKLAQQIQEHNNERKRDSPRKSCTEYELSEDTYDTAGTDVMDGDCDIPSLMELTQRMEDHYSSDEDETKSTVLDVPIHAMKTCSWVTGAMQVGLIRELVVSFLDGRDAVRACSVSKCLAETAGMCVQIDHYIGASTFIKLLETEPNSSCVSRFRISKITLDGCDNNRLRDLVAFGALDYVEDIDLAWNHSLTDLSPLSRLSYMRCINLEYCSKLNDLLPIATCKGLRTLNLNYCTGIDDITPLQDLDLRSLSIAGIAQQSWLPGIQKSWSCLSMLDLSCTNVNDVRCLAPLQMLQVLRLCQTAVTDVPSLPMSTHNVAA